MTRPKVLLVDDEEMIRHSLAKILEQQEFDVTVAGNVTEALKRINEEAFDVLLSDLHMPGAGDGLTVVSAMRHSNPAAVTMLFTSFPAMDAATSAIVHQADEILVKPMSIPALVDAIRQRLKAGPIGPRKVESVAVILERTVETTIDEWYACVEVQPSLTAVPLSREDRTGHLPEVFRDLETRLHSFKPLGTRDHTSSAASDHGRDRFHQGYSAAMMVEESRILQVCIFQTLQSNLATIDFSVLLLGVMTIADEVDSQLSQAMESYVAEARTVAPGVEDALPVG